MAEENLFTSLDAVLTGLKMRNAIKQSGYSIKELQEMLGLSCPQPIYRWIKGRTLPSIDNLYMLSRILDVHMEDLLAPMEPNGDSK
ncbi:MAG TPA: XRE family transcriptional regulator [Lachnospiraceae bacterium]|nr:XRE family transcriptional regulator [Lachnospiraceae bacterium]